MIDRCFLGLTAAFYASWIQVVVAGSGLFYEDAPFHYSDRKPNDPVALLVKQNVPSYSPCLTQFGTKAFADTDSTVYRLNQ